MNESEANEIGLAALELAECRKKLACLKTRAERFRKEIDKGTDMLIAVCVRLSGLLRHRQIGACSSHCGHPRRSCENRYKDCLLPRATSSKGQSPSEDGWPSYDDLVELHKSHEATSARIRELEDRFRDWGVLPEQRRAPH